MGSSNFLHPYVIFQEITVIMNFIKHKRIVRLVGIIVFLLLLRHYIVQPFRTFGISMEPTYRDGSFLLVDKITYKIRCPKRGDVIVFRTQTPPYMYFVKRIVGLSEEKVAMKQGMLFINERRIEERYLVEQGNWDIKPFTVRKGCVFVIGDNRSMSKESHLLTEVSMRNIVGRVIGKR